MPVYLKIENPHKLTAEDARRVNVGNYAKAQRELFAEIKAQGYDGILWNDKLNKEWVVLGDPTQIKSATGNIGKFDPEKADINLSRSGQSPQREDTGRRIHMEDLNAVAQAFRAAFPGLPVHVLETERQAPKELLAWVNGQGARGDWGGAMYNGEVYLLRSGLMDAAHAMETAIHEAEHAGLERMFGQQLDGVMLQIYQTNPSVRGKADALMQRYRYSAVRATNEVLADMGPRARSVIGWRKLVAKVRDILRGITVGGKPMVKTWSDNDVSALVLRALKAAKQQASGAAQGKLTALSQGDGLRVADGFADRVRKVIADSIAGRMLSSTPIDVMDRTPATLRALGWGELPVSMNPKEIDKVHFDHGMTADRIARLVPETLERPSLMLRSATQPGRVVMVANEYGEKPVLLVVSPDADTPAGKHQLIVSMYPKDEGWDWVARQIRNGNLIYRDPQSVVVTKIGGAVTDAQESFAQKGRPLAGLIPESSAVRGELKGKTPRRTTGFPSEGYKVLLPSDLRKYKDEPPAGHPSLSRTGQSEVAPTVQQQTPNGQGNNPSSLKKRYLAAVDRVIHRMDAAINGLGDLPDQNRYLADRYIAMGRIAQIDDVTGLIRKSFSNATKDDKKAIYEYLTTRGATGAAIKDASVRDMAIKAKRFIGNDGQVWRGTRNPAASHDQRAGR